MAKSENIERLDFDGLSYYDGKIKNHIEKNLSEATDSIKKELNSKAPQSEVDDIKSKIPSQATSENKLADKDFVNSSIATSTAEFKGTHDSLDSLQAVTADANDYGFVVTKDSDGNTVYKRYKYVEGAGWVYEFDLNNSSFTAAQWAAIQSGITKDLVDSLKKMPDLETKTNGLVTKTDTLDSRLKTIENYVASLNPQDNNTYGLRNGILEIIAGDGEEVIVDSAETAQSIALESLRQDMLMIDGNTDPEMIEEVRKILGDDIFNELAVKSVKTQELHPVEDSIEEQIERAKMEYIERREHLKDLGDFVQGEIDAVGKKKDVESDKTM